MWSRRPTAAGQSRWRTRIGIAAITTPSAPSRLTSLSSWRRASCRDWLTSSVQPATSALPEIQRAWRVVPRSSCRDPIEMPSASPTGTQPALISFAKSWPDTSEVKGADRPCPAPGARTAVPMTANCVPPRERAPGHVDADHAVPAELRALGDHPVDGGVPRLAHGLHERAERPRAALPGHLSRRPQAATRRRAIPAPPGSRTRWRPRRRKRPRPNTWPTGSKPTLRIAANSSAVSADPHVPLDRSAAIRASATAGSSALTPLA